MGEALAPRIGNCSLFIVFVRVKSEAFSTQTVSFPFPRVPNNLPRVFSAGCATSADDNENRSPASSLPHTANELSGVRYAVKNLTRAL